MDAYQFAISRFAYFSYSDPAAPSGGIEIPAPGFLLLSGPDSRSFLQRQTTADIGQLNPNSALLSVLTSPNGRILDVFYVLEQPAEDGQEVSGDLALLTLPGRGEQTARFLKSRIFFNDQVVVKDLSSQIVTIDLVGPQAGSLLQELGADNPPAPGESRLTRLSGLEVRLVGLNPALDSGWRLVFQSSYAPQIDLILAQAGAARLPAQDFSLLRLEAGFPSAGGELVEDYTPLEVNLRGAVSDNKGCYTGQEVIARQINYDKVTRQMVGLMLDGEADTGADVRSEAGPAGKITSAGLSPRFGPIALAVLRRPYHKPGTRLAVTSGSAVIPARVADLPFSVDAQE